MTDEQMRERINAIEKQRDILKQEKDEYLNYFREKEKQDRINQRKSCVGKYFKTMGLIDNKLSHIKAFKILKLHPRIGETYAECFALIDGYLNKGLSVTVLDLWGLNKPRLVYTETDAKVIDFYQEITESEFESLYSDMLKEMVYKNV